MKMKMQFFIMQMPPYGDANENFMMQIFACAILIKSFPFKSNILEVPNKDFLETQFIPFMGYSFFNPVRFECIM